MRTIPLALAVLSVMGIARADEARVPVAALPALVDLPVGSSGSSTPPPAAPVETTAASDRRAIEPSGDEARRRFMMLMMMRDAVAGKKSLLRSAE
jgi:hypothetical protein